ncbi:accessory factor UbiK family protein [Hwanghaeella grinnelliae]|uniref:Accessory factor UbiK family protein n=1 Tax=Hwanghaeella grinnelliae TaxID=2500179 RepID=A0A3S2WQD6_9PROT|nr:accessory factor UbiK family protein [Hwanghaeella grinnelliae]RVU34936.1 accessory factor UbiK family protein [Hwanghaeella grinnelliae]
MQTTGRLFDDIARVASGAAGALSGVRDEVEALVKHRMERILADMDLVPRDEFEAVKEVAATARAEQEKLEKRVTALEAALAGETTPRKPAKKATARKSASKSAKESQQDG